MYKERESVLYHGIIKTLRNMLKNEAIVEFFNNFEVFCDRGKELFRILYFASETKDESWLNLWTFFTTVSNKTRYAYDFPLCFPHDLIII